MDGSAMTPGRLQAIRCTISSCSCDCFQPGKPSVRLCESCKHGWVAHALDKLGFRSMLQLGGMQVEMVQPSVVFDIASLMLYGSQATPIRLKILLDRLFSVLQHEEVLQVLHGFGWSYEDYARGYILQEAAGRVLEKWSVCSREEEQVILQQFLRFGETRSIAQDIILKDVYEQQERHLLPHPRNDSDIKKFLELSATAAAANDKHFINISPQSAKPIEMRYPIRGFPSFSNHLPKLPAVQVSTQSLNTPEKEVSNSSVLKGSASPMAGSPLRRLQTMRPFDCNRNLNDLMSAKQNEKGLLAVQGHTSPHLLPRSSSEPYTTPQSPTINTQSVSTKPKSSETVKSSVYVARDPTGALDFSKKETSISASTAAAIAATISSRSNPLTPPSNSYSDQRKPPTSAAQQRRNYSPTPGYGGTLVSPSGKKRVLCTACNKTFCDKGALKIHYSAVHLKEMHKCTVDGCNMMFSSRRSRNRHSANPNPKLHVPQGSRRKVPDGSIMLEHEKSPSSDGPLPLFNINSPHGMPPIEIKPIATMPLLADMSAAHQRTPRPRP